VTGKPSAKEAFVARLAAFHRECGGPSFGSLEKISQDLPQLYPGPWGSERNLPKLSVTALSEVLAGKRKKLPTPHWLASFVLCCQRRAAEACVIPDDPGISTLPGWQAALRAASEARDAPPAAGTGSSGLPDRRASAVPVRLPPQQQDFVAGHGPYGQALLARAEAGDPDALYRVALLLGTDPARSEDAQSLLILAGAAGHDLLDENPGQLAPAEVARHAYRLGRAAEARGLPDEARAWDQAAARGGLLSGAVRHATDRLAEHGEHQAATWLADAAARSADAAGQSGYGARLDLGAGLAGPAGPPS
jgi:hypothetical protein